MRNKSVKSLVIGSAVVGALALGTASASDSPWHNYIGAGFYDFGDTGFFIEGAAQINEQFVLNAEIGDTYDTSLRIGGRFLTGVDLGTAPLFLSLGYSDYSNSFDGVYFGAGITHPLDSNIHSIFELNHDTAGDGFWRFRSGLMYHLNQNLSVQGSYSLNTDSVKNEFKLGVSYRF
ncbi:MAG: porin family protein [Aliidiomarina sp.]|uniref:outer membrane beta-barrel protein n=1 Tax=Aliidiomarina sp. TaxID=1872439 RepID=UPI0025BB7A7B|nr:outer membrane beta-barrel protein [Aliidiomarina sp.]MCH8502621.1 porin family protein [Aliidiomarina sp.]